MSQYKVVKFFQVKYLFPLVILIIGSLAGCQGSESAVNLYLPPKYLSAVEITAFDLVQAYQHPSSRIEAERLLNGKYVIVKNIEITKEVIKNSTDIYLNWGYTLYIKPSDLSDLKSLRVGEKIDAVGICLGKPPGEMVVVLDQCIIESAGILPLPIEGGEGMVEPIY